MDSNQPAYDAARHKRSGRGKIYDSIIDTIGDTPLVRLPNLTQQLKPKGEVVAKLEFFNPIGSVKDRIGVGMIEALEQRGILTPGTSTIVEPTSGNTGIALAFVAASKGYPLILVMPESMSLERRKMLILLGARLELTPAEKGMRGAVARAQEILAEVPGVRMPRCSRASIMPTPMRSFTEPIGLKNSSLASTSPLGLKAAVSLGRRTKGVSPMVSRMESKILPRPARRYRAAS
jgi:cysteine synthase A